MLYLEAQGRKTKAPISPSASFSANSAQPPGRKFHRHISPANLDPPLERRLNSHISSTLLGKRRDQMVAVSEAGKVPPACDGNLVGHLCSFCLLRRDRTLRPISKFYMKRYWEPHGRVRATNF